MHYINNAQIDQLTLLGIIILGTGNEFPLVWIIPFDLLCCPHIFSKQCACDADDQRWDCSLNLAPTSEAKNTS